MTNSIRDYEEMFSRLALTELEVQEGDFKLKLKRESLREKPAKAPIEPSESPVKEPDKDSKEKRTRGTEVKAPLLGVFYALSGDKRAVAEGDRVSKGQALCTLEAMKMMNEVVAPVDGTVTKVLASEGDLVEFDQVLFVIE
jgi:acetyl-CoA carboxylase biotin carboxyl carrier protein